MNKTQNQELAARYEQQDVRQERTNPMDEIQSTASAPAAAQHMWQHDERKVYRSTTPTTSAPAAHEYTTPTTPAPAARERQEYTMPTASAPAAHERQEYTMLIVPTLTIHRSNHEQSVYPKPPSAQQEERQEHLQFEFNYMTMNCVEAGYNPRKAQIV